MSLTCWSTSFSAMAFFVYASSSESGTYVPGHILQVGCGSVGLILACPISGAAKHAMAATKDRTFFIWTSSLVWVRANVNESDASIYTKSNFTRNELGKFGD